MFLVLGLNVEKTFEMRGGGNTFYLKNITGIYVAVAMVVLSPIYERGSTINEYRSSTHLVSCRWSSGIAEEYGVIAHACISRPI